MHYSIGFDIGGTRVKCGAVTPGGTVLAKRVLPTRPEAGPETLLESILNQIQEIRSEAAGDPAGIGLGLSGAVDPKLGAVYLPGKFKGLEGFPIVPKLAAATGLPVVADNDARVVLMAEKRFGLAVGKNWVVSLTIGTGLGSGAILDGKILRDPHLQFGTQLGHLVIQADGGKLCLTNAHGTGESLCSATALAMGVRDGLQRGISSVLSDCYFDDPQSVDFAAVIEGVEAGDRLCIHELNMWRRRLGWVVVNAVHAYAPELIVIGGGGAHASRHFLDFLREHVNSHIFRYPPNEPVAIEVSNLVEDAGVLGAAALVLDTK